MPKPSFLSIKQQKNLQKMLKKHENSEIRERILILLLLNDGKTQSETANFIGCSLRKVAYWSINSDPENIDSLKDKRMEGNHKKATDKYIELLLQTIKQEPLELGCKFKIWTASKLATYLKIETGIELSASQVRRILAKNKINLPLSKNKSKN